ncbi:hypothetical protein MHU86_7760 [Fragilaria crotonensis]|nr:hypothetical protein MHU86_7760 [Fragilaria crotonensis]
MSLFRLLMAPLRLFRSSVPKVVESDVATTKIVPELVDESIPVPTNVVEVTAPVVTPLKEKVEEEQVSAPVAIPLVQNETPPTPVVEAAPIKVVSTKATSAARPVGDRWATATVDLSGDWILIISDEFKEQYDEYLKRLGQPMIVRGIALGIIGLTSEYTEQTDEGRSLFIRGINARGLWERTLVASGADGSNETYEPIERIVVTADDEKVRAEAWWEEGGTVHMSWMRGVTKYGGGDFESKRYLEQDGKVLVCESIFYPQDQKREKASVTWKFVRKGATL